MHDKFWMLSQKFRKATVSFVMSVCPHRSSRLPLDGFWRKLIFEISFFEKPVEKIEASLQSDNNNRYFTWRPIYIFYHISLNFMFEFPCIVSLYYVRNQQDATLAVSFISHCKITLHVSDTFCVHHQEY